MSRSSQLLLSFLLGAGVAVAGARVVIVRGHDEDARLFSQIGMRLSDPVVAERLGEWRSDLAVVAFDDPRSAAIHYFLRAIEENGGVSNGANIYLASFLGERNCRAAIYFCERHEAVNGRTAEGDELLERLRRAGCFVDGRRDVNLEGSEPHAAIPATDLPSSE
jgi:hypothetical protein